MAKSESFGSREAQSLRERSPRQGTHLSATTRIDCAHEVASSVLESPSALQASAAVSSADDESTAEQLRLQADQLAGHLRSRQKELDHREAELNARMAKFESGERIVRLWIGEREADLAACEQESAQRQQDILQQQREVERRLARLAAAEAALQRTFPSAAGQQEPQGSCVAETSTAREKRLDDAEARLTEAQAETQKLHEQLLHQRRALAEKAVAMRERMAAERRQATDDLEQKRLALQRRADHVDQCWTALNQLRVELGRMHGETLEMRLATEELWAQLSGAAPPAALIQSLGQIRAKLAEQYRQADAELANQRKELEVIRNQLVQQHEALVEQKQRFEQWAASRQEESRLEATRLVAREQQLHDEEARLHEQSQRWQAERTKLEQKIRRLQTSIAEPEEAAIPA